MHIFILQTDTISNAYIVVGEISADDTGRGKENIITEVIRMAKLQEKSKRESIE